MPSIQQSYAGAAGDKTIYAVQRPLLPRENLDPSLHVGGDAADRQVDGEHLRLVVTNMLTGEPTMLDGDPEDMEPSYPTQIFVRIRPPRDSVIGIPEYEALVSSRPEIIPKKEKHAQALAALQKAEAELDRLCELDADYIRYQAVLDSVEECDSRRPIKAINWKIKKSIQDARRAANIRRREIADAHRDLQIGNLEGEERRTFSELNSAERAYWGKGGRSNGEDWRTNRTRMIEACYASLAAAQVNQDTIRKFDLAATLVDAYRDERGVAFNCGDDLLGRPDLPALVEHPIDIPVELFGLAMESKNVGKIIRRHDRFATLVYTGDVKSGLTDELYGPAIVGIEDGDSFVMCVLGPWTWRLCMHQAEQALALRLTNHVLAMAQGMEGSTKGLITTPPRR
jgi:hypothetical protein